MSAGVRLARALQTMAIEAGCPVRVTAASERPWASATFVGARHTLVLEANPCAALDHWLAGLPEADIAVPGYLVVDITVERTLRGLRVEALLLVDA